MLHQLLVEVKVDQVAGGAVCGVVATAGMGHILLLKELDYQNQPSVAVQLSIIRHRDRGEKRADQPQNQEGHSGARAVGRPAA